MAIDYNDQSKKIEEQRRIEEQKKAKELKDLQEKKIEAQAQKQLTGLEKIKAWNEQKNNLDQEKLRNWKTRRIIN